jgi:uncharacterized protein
MQALAALLCGLLFGSGLTISGMMQPTKVLAFLDILGDWDPTLAVVMAAALAVSGLGYMLARQLGRPLLAVEMAWPARRDIDAPLVIGAALFGAGWGLSGLCPGPALANLATLAPRVLAFVIAMTAGMALCDLWQQHRARRRIPAAADG